MTTQAKVGTLVVIITIILLVLAPGQHKRAPVLSNTYKLEFTQVHGLRPGDPVKVAGVPQGVIVDIDFASPERQRQFSLVTGGKLIVEASVALNPGVEIPESSSYKAVSNLNGTRWIDIIPAGGGTLIGPDEPFFAERVSAQEDQLSRTLRTMRTLSEQTNELRAEIAKPEFPRNIKDTASNFRFYSRELSQASVRAPEQLEALEDQINLQEANILQQLEKMDERVGGIRERLLALGPKARENLEAWQARFDGSKDQLQILLNQALEMSARYQTMVEKATAEYADRDKLQEMVITARKWARQIDTMQAIASDLHALSSDPRVQEDLRNYLKQFKARSEQMKEQIESLERRIDSLPF